MRRRKTADRAATFICCATLIALAVALAILLAPILARGAGAMVFRATSEHRRMLLEQFRVGSETAVAAETAAKNAALAPMRDALRRFENDELPALPPDRRRELRHELDAFKDALRRFAGPLPGEPRPALLRDQYGAQRLDHARLALRDALGAEVWEYPVDADGAPLPGVLRRIPREEIFAGTALAPAIARLAQLGADPLLPRLTFYRHFLTLGSVDSHFFGGIFPELKGTIFLAVLAMLIAAPIGVLTAVHLAEYTRQGRATRLVRVCIDTLAGVPSVVFGLFGLAFFIVTLRVSAGKSVLAGSLTLALLVLPTMIRSAEEALRTVPDSYREAALSLGAGKWRGILTVVLPAALPGILTGIVICMGRVAGETAPVIFTAVVSAGPIAKLSTIATAPTPALSWNIYNLVSEHEAADQLRHVQYGMVATLVLLVLLLNLAAIIIRTRINKTRE